jgi:uncharacterized protein YbaR (Trm112 family)
MPFDVALLEILACPVPSCHGRLQLQGDYLVCASCKLRYRFEGPPAPSDLRWPVLIPEEAEPAENALAAPGSAAPSASAPGP